jgi:glycosyltransferase involved in cell wall biosynthesis
MVRVSESNHSMQLTEANPFQDRMPYGARAAATLKREPEAAVIVPAYNEASRIEPVIRALRQSALTDEIIVVSDGSTDDTARVAREAGADRVVELPQNLGKGAAMQAGFEATLAPVVAFVDADLIGLSPQHVDSLLAPILSGQADGTLGVFRGGAGWSDMAQLLAPTLSGQRAMRRTLFETVPMLEDLRMGVEVSLSLHLHRCHARVARVALPGITHVPKEHKFGFVKGSKARAEMYGDIARALWRLRRGELKRSGLISYPTLWESDAR